MKNYLRTFSQLAVFSGLSFLSCTDNNYDLPPSKTGSETIFNIEQTNNSGVFGTITFSELSDNSIIANLKLHNISGDPPYRVTINNNTSLEGGTEIIQLEDIDPTTLESKTIRLIDNNRRRITFNQISSIDAHISIQSGDIRNTAIIAQGDIGLNAPSGRFKSYMINSADELFIGGDITFIERINGELLTVVNLYNGGESADFAAEVNFNSAVEGGDLLAPLNNVSFGVGKTNLDKMGNGTVMTFDDVLNIDAHLRLKADDGKVVALADLGTNELSCWSTFIPVQGIEDDSISGFVNIIQRLNGEYLVVMEMTGLNPSSEYEINLIMENQNTGIKYEKALIPIDKRTGRSYTNWSILDNDDFLNFEDLVVLRKEVIISEKGSLTDIIAKGVN